MPLIESADYLKAGQPVSLKVDRSKMLKPETAADAILFALKADPQAVPMEINIQPESHLFF